MGPLKIISTGGSVKKINTSENLMLYPNPKNWKELEKFTHDLFTEIDCDCSLNERIKTARGFVNVDVLVRDHVSSPSLTYLCECKYWNKRISKDIIHAFRTVVLDYGANRGYIISKMGFQKGAVTAVKNSNIVLLTWQELQDMFEKRWIESKRKHLMDVIYEINNILSGKYPRRNIKKEINIRRHLLGLLRKFAVLFASGGCMCMDDMENIRRRFPFKTKVQNPYYKKSKKVTIKSFRDYFDTFLPFAESILEEVKRYA